MAENVLDRKFEVDAPVAWATDITYVWTSEGWLYLAAILDLFSRRVVGFAMSERIDRGLVLDALRDALGRRVPNAGLLHTPTVARSTPATTTRPASTASASSAA